MVGYFESLSDGECGGIAPHSGSRYFAVGGLCDTEDYAEVYQRVQVPTELTSTIDSGSSKAVYGGFLANWSGSDEPSFKLIFYDEDMNFISETPPSSSLSDEWTQKIEHTTIPSQTRTIDMVLMGTKNAGFDNDSYFDDLELNIQNCTASAN